MIGIDVSKAGVRMVQFRGNSLIRLAYKEIPISVRGAPEAKFREFVSRIIPALVKEGNFEGRNVSSALKGPEEVNLFFLTLPEMERSDLEDALILEIKKGSNFSIEDSVHEFYSRQAENGKLRIISAISPREVIDKKVAVLESADLHIARFDITGHALENLLGLTKELSESDVSLFLDIGACVTTMNFFAGNLLQFSRELSLGTDDLISAIAKPVITPNGRLDLSLEDAEKLKSEHGIIKGMGEIEGLPASQLSAMMRPFVERLLREIKNSIGHFGRQFNLKTERIFLYGGAAALKGLDEILRETLNVEVTGFDPFKNLSIQLPAGQEKRFTNFKLDFVISAGLALGEKRRFNILPSQMKLVHKLSAVRVGISIVLSLLAIPLFLSYFTMHARVKDYCELLRKNKLYIAPFKERLTSINELRKWKGLTGERERLISRLERQPLWYGVLKEISNIVPESIALDSIRSVLLSDKRIGLNIKGHLAVEELTFSKFLISMDDSPFFEDVVLISRKEEGGRISFELRCGLIY